MIGFTPAGFVTSISSNSLKITGDNNVSQYTEYSYKITAGVSGCPSLEDVKEGSITVLLRPSLELQNPGSGTNQQTLCEDNQLQNIEYELNNGADDVQFQWISNIPDGITTSLSSGVYRISGTPKAQESTSVYTYLITPKNESTGCLGETLTGSITVNASSSLKLLSFNNEPPPYCEGNQILPIEYSVGSAVTNIDVQWKKDGLNLPLNTYPPGISYNFTNNQFVIGGNLSENISATTEYSYEIIPTGGSCGGGVNPGGKLTFSPVSCELSSSSVGELNQVKCEGLPIDDITLNLIDGAVNPTVVGLPAG